MAKIKQFIIDNLHWLVVASVTVLCAIFLIAGTPNEDGYISLAGGEVIIEESTTEFIENAQEALNRLMNEDQPTDETVVEKYKDGFDEDEGLGGSTTLATVISRIRADGDNDNGNGWQCSKYTAYLATGKKDYSSSHPDYGPVNGKNVAAWLVENFGWKYIDTPVKGAIGSGGFNTLYGHTVVYLYSTGTNTAMVNDANYVPLTVGTHNMNIDGWVWVVPGDYTPDEPTPAPDPEPTPVDPTPSSDTTSDCSSWNVQKGDTMSAIMKACTGDVDWSNMDSYADKWISQVYNPGYSVYWGWTHGTGYGLLAGDMIKYSK